MKRTIPLAIALVLPLWGAVTYTPADDPTTTDELITNITTADDTITIEEGGATWDISLPPELPTGGLINQQLTISPSTGDPVWSDPEVYDADSAIYGNNGYGTIGDALDGVITNLFNHTTSDSDLSASNEVITDVSLSGNDLTITEAGTPHTVTLPSSPATLEASAGDGTPIDGVNDPTGASLSLIHI